MQKIIPVAILVLLLGGGYYFYSQSKSSSPTQSMNKTASKAQEFARAIESGKPTLCVMTKGEEKMEYLIKGKMMRANFTIVAEGKPTLSHMINDEKYFYMWSDGQIQGTKMNLLVPSPSPVPNAPKDIEAPKFDSVDDYDKLKNNGYTIDCKGATVTDSDFLPPTDVKFIDPSEIMRAIPSPDANGQIDMKQIEELKKKYGATE